MQVDLTKLNYRFKTKPLLIGGKAKEFYGVRVAGKDIDLVVTKEDYENLTKMYPDNLEDLYGDLGVKIHGFEIWKTICSFTYDELSFGAFEKENLKIASLEKLLFLAALGMHKEKYHKDLELIVKKIFEIRYKK
ncbi:MAG: hypothetical protein UR52_C0002G0002 [Candidatus Gottesmanbacteria bacterium GW2011_GWA1_34_13]|uniref:Uncharacterized protein n=1 Tax=Candidatus Gottesmanbacteria bacterium GW2011_GWA1_34_13 TaxID=1618434 RepID=A0A0G0ASB6_9BACT|nr:MAG: hypothetical protein UR52_C0002G0002 [Candidatus Gottesmanbacteria bacterium GW2011_GWA1_34_13]